MTSDDYDIRLADAQRNARRLRSRRYRLAHLEVCRERVRRWWKRKKKQE